MLTYSSRRESLINNLISAAIQYKLDGINVDFESLDPSIGDSYIQFIRELSLKCANNGIVLSVDNYPPTAYTAFYNRSEQAVFADYVILMGYDEHYAGSEEAGSVSSIGFVNQGVADTLQSVPADQLILGMPFTHVSGARLRYRTMARLSVQPRTPPTVIHSTSWTATRQA